MRHTVQDRSQLVDSKAGKRGLEGTRRRAAAMCILLGCLMPIVGVATTLTMTRLHRVEGHADHAAFLSVSLFDMLALAVTCRRSQQTHGRGETGASKVWFSLRPKPSATTRAITSARIG